MVMFMKYQVLVDSDEYGVFSTEDEAMEYVSELMSSFKTGGEVLSLNDPFYEEPDSPCIEVVEI